MVYVASELMNINHPKEGKFEIEKASIKRLTVPRNITQMKGYRLLTAIH